MLSKSQISFIKSLHQKKYRKEHGLFIVEGFKSIQDFISSSFVFHSIYALPTFIETLQKTTTNIKLFEVNPIEISKISALQNPQGILAILQTPKSKALNPASFSGEINIMLDGIQDPGNLGTIIRTADWFGFKKVYCSLDSAEAFNPKTVQASMGSLSRVEVIHTDIHAILSANPTWVGGAFLEGQNIYSVQWPSEGFILLGNEGAGISEASEKFVTQKITIPGLGGAESLNVGISTALFCSEIRREKLKSE